MRDRPDTSENAPSRTCARTTASMGRVRVPVAPDSRRVSRAISANKRRTAEYTPRRDVSVADAVPIRRRSAAALTPAFVTQRARVRRRGHARLGRETQAAAAETSVALPQPHPFRRGADPAAGGRDRGVDVDQPRATRLRSRNAWIPALRALEPRLLLSGESSSAPDDRRPRRRSVEAHGKMA
jgi:hypothetical protein